ncbi:cation/H+ exchanger, CPA1 family protein [Tanacetum coccineum]
MKHEPDQCCLSSSPDDPTSVFLLSTYGFPILTFCRLDCTRNKLKWAKFPYGKELRTIIGKNGYLHDLTCCNGKVYSFNSDEDNHTVIEIDIAVEEKKVVMRLLSFVEHPGFSFTRFCKTNGIIGIGRYLKGYCSELFYIEIDLEDETSDTVGDVHLYKLDMSNMIWEKMEDLKDAIFFLQVDSEYPVYYTPYPTSDMSSWGMLEYRLGGDNDNLKQEEDKDDGNIVVKSATISKPPVFDSKKRTRTDESYLLNLPFHILESIIEHYLMMGDKYFIKTPQELIGDIRVHYSRESMKKKNTLETVVAKPPGCVGSSFLVECEQHLLLVIVGTLEESVDLFKLNDLTKEWEKLDGLATPGRERKRDFVDNPNGLFSAQTAPKPPPAMYSVVEGMKVGGKGVIVPPVAWYGKRGQNEIPPNTTFELNLELLQVTRPEVK